MGVAVKLSRVAEVDSLSAVPVGCLGVALTKGMLGVSMRFVIMWL